LNGLFLLTIKELMTKKIILTLFIIETVFCVTLIFALNIKIGGMDSKVMLDLFGHAINQNGGSLSIDADTLLGYIQSGIAIAIFFVSLFVSLFSTSAVFPEMLKKGNIDLILSKPFSRTNIFIQRFSGSLAVVAANIFYLIMFSWIVLSLKFGIWNFRFPAGGLIIFIFFFNIYSLMTLIAMLFRNGILSLMLTYFLVFILSPLIAAIERFSVSKNELLAFAVSLLHGSLPRISETVMLLGNMISFKDFQLSVIWTTLAAGSIASYFALAIFKKSDF
jgi:ABC-type transport system involved in multi-copper enzyme maturation permease subunit